MKLIIHPGVRRDVREILDYYDQRSDLAGDRFYAELMTALDEVAREPERYHFVSPSHRRCSCAHFPYHLIFEIVGNSIQVLVLRHHKRHPAFGLGRKW